MSALPRVGEWLLRHMASRCSAGHESRSTQEGHSRFYAALVASPRKCWGTLESAIPEALAILF